MANLPSLSSSPPVGAGLPQGQCKQGGKLCINTDQQERVGLSQWGDLMQRLDEQFTSTLPLIQRLGFSRSAFNFAMRYHMHVLLLVIIAVFKDEYEREQTRRRFALLLLLARGGMMKKMIQVGLLLLVIPALSGCWLLAAGGAGAYGGYKMKEEGYTVQNPVKKEAPAESTK